MFLHLAIDSDPNCQLDPINGGLVGEFRSTIPFNSGVFRVRREATADSCFDALNPFVTAEHFKQLLTARCVLRGSKNVPVAHPKSEKMMMNICWKIMKPYEKLGRSCDGLKTSKGSLVVRKSTSKFPEFELVNCGAFEVDLLLFFGRPNQTYNSAQTHESIGFTFGLMLHCFFGIRRRNSFALLCPTYNICLFM